MQQTLRSCSAPDSLPLLQCRRCLLPASCCILHEILLLLHRTCVLLSRWDDAIRVADTSRHPQTAELKRAHYQWLLQTSQEDKAVSTVDHYITCFTPNRHENPSQEPTGGSL
jgi:hypothetical protein